MKEGEEQKIILEGSEFQKRIREDLVIFIEIKMREIQSFFN